MTTNNPGDFIDQFRHLAGMTDEEIRLDYSEKLLAWFDKFTASELTGVSLPVINTSEGLVEAVRQLQVSKQKWSRYHGELIIELHSGDKELQIKAHAALVEISSTCPWMFLRKSAGEHIG